MQFNGVKNKEHQSTLAISSFHIWNDSEFYLLLRHFCLCFECELAALFRMAAHHTGSFSQPSLPFFTVMGAYFPLLGRSSWLGCQDLPAMGAVSTQELAANSGSSRMSQAPRQPPLSDAVVNNNNNKNNNNKNNNNNNNNNHHHLNKPHSHIHIWANIQGLTQMQVSIFFHVTKSQRKLQSSLAIRLSWSFLSFL